MPFRGVADPEELAILRYVLDVHCAANDIPYDDHRREQIATRILALFMAGVTSAERLKVALAKETFPGGIPK